jgi:23S rRNA (uracil1939-C5)-methyltransferase
MRCPSSASPCRSSPPTSRRSTTHINRVLVGGRCACWQPRPHERVIDWFCGLGNFTLPLATRAGQVLGIEGSETLVQRARDNAARNGWRQDQFAARNLFELRPTTWWP